MSVHDRKFDTCIKCRQKLLLNPENDMCITCERDTLREEVDMLNICLEQLRREKKEMYDIIIFERKKASGE